MYDTYVRLRDERGLNDYQVSKLAGIPDSTLYDWVDRAKERPELMLSLPNCIKLAEALGVSLDELAGRRKE